MSPGFIAAVVALVVAQLALPVRLAFLPLVIAGCHLGNVEVLPELTTARLLVLLGLARALSGGFFTWKPAGGMDALFITFSVVSVLSTIGHTADEYIPSPLSARAGLVLNAFGTYLYARTYIPDLAAFKRYAFIMPFVLIPLAVSMIIEQRTQRNLYYLLGSNAEFAPIREGRVRAVGPFRHPILAGTAGATVLPFAYLLWRSRSKALALVALGSCMGVTLACASSGPLAAVAVTAAAVGFWRWRQHLRLVVWGIIAVALLYNIVKGRGPWYLMASIDLVGGSTGWHRAKLIDQGFNYMGEWWLFGTDYTRHWMGSGVRWNPNMIDLTNYYLHLGVTGGVPLMLCLMGFIFVGFKSLTNRMAELRATASEDELVLWCAGASLAAHAVSFVSISYFDQMYIYFYFLLGCIPGLVSTSSSLNTLTPPRSSVAAAQPEVARPLRFYS